MKLRFLLLAALPISLFASDPTWRSRAVAIKIESDGALAIHEDADVEVPADATGITRRYWADAEEQIAVIRVVQNGVEIKPDHFHLTSWGGLQFSVPPGGGGYHYAIDTRVTGATIPVWGIRPGLRTFDPHPALIADPFERLSQTVALWRDRGPNRYLVDYQFFYPEGDAGVQPAVSFDPKDWKPVHAGETIGTAISPAPFGSGGSFRISHLFDYQRAGTPAAVDIRPHAIRLASIVSLPILALLLWLAYFVFVSRRQKDQIDERWLREHLFKEPAEMIAAEFSGCVPTINIEQFLRRLEREGKVAIDVQVINKDTDDEHVIVTLALNVPRNQFSDYERSVIDSLMPQADAVTSEDIDRRHAGTDYDPTDRAEKFLENIASKNVKTAKSPVLSRTFSFALFITGICFLGFENLRFDREPIAFLATMLFVMPLVNLWPSRKVWILTQRTPRAMLLLLIPIVLVCAFIVIFHSITERPIGIYGSIGVVLAFLGGFHALVADAAKTDRRGELFRAQEWFRQQRRTAPATIRDEWIPYMDALEVRHGKKQVEQDEHWGYALSTFAE